MNSCDRLYDRKVWYLQREFARNIRASTCFRDPFLGKKALGRRSLLGVNDQHLPEVASKHFVFFFTISNYIIRTVCEVRCS